MEHPEKALHEGGTRRTTTEDPTGRSRPKIRERYPRGESPTHSAGAEGISCENLARIGQAFKSYHLNFPRGGAETPIKGVTCDLQCPFSNFVELFQSKVVCENLVQIG